MASSSATVICNGSVPGVETGVDDDGTMELTDVAAACRGTVEPSELEEFACGMGDGILDPSFLE